VTGPRGLYFEELEVGQNMTSRGRTITEADIVNFAGVSGDYNPIHTDADFASKTPFGQRIAHGMLGLSAATGQAYALGFMERTVIAFMGLEWKFRAPVLIGDTITVNIEVTEKKDAKRMGGGLVTLDIKVVNQRGEVTQKGEWTVLVAMKELVEAVESN
jgi:3-hydroxybutyryl-CoA dehydratase